jgi:hypothetical protein
MLKLYKYGLINRGSILDRGIIFFLLQFSDKLWGPPSLLSIGFGGLCPLGQKRPGREIDYSSLISVEVNNM